MQFDPEVLHTFPGIGVAEGWVRSVVIRPESPPLEQRKQEVFQDLLGRFTLETVKDDPVFRAYRDFFWRVGVDPTKIRPASEALVRRVLGRKALPQISTAVDAYNLASAQSGVPIAAFDADLLHGQLLMRFAQEGESFRGIGMQEPIRLHPNQVVLADEQEIVAIYPYRDADATRVTLVTRNIFLVTCGVPGIDQEKVKAAYEIGVRYLKEFNGGNSTEPVISPAP